MIRRLLLAAALLPAAFSSGIAAAQRIDGALSWPSVDNGARFGRAFPDFVKSSEYPFKSSPGYTNKLQGVAHDSSHWYMTNKAKLRKISVRCDLGGPAACSASVGIPWQLGAYNHLGDLDYYDGRLYVPLEGSAPAIGVPPRQRRENAHPRPRAGRRLLGQRPPLPGVRPGRPGPLRASTSRPDASRPTSRSRSATTRSWRASTSGTSTAGTSRASPSRP
jgi:hypothetical protein